LIFGIFGAISTYVRIAIMIFISKQLTREWFKYYFLMFDNLTLLMLISSIAYIIKFLKKSEDLAEYPIVKYIISFSFIPLYACFNGNFRVILKFHPFTRS
jgi:hypothetical protein